MLVPRTKCAPAGHWGALPHPRRTSSTQRTCCCRAAAAAVQVNLEYLLVDSRTFVTSEDNALRTFFGASVDSSGSYRVEIEVGAAAGAADARVGRGRAWRGVVYTAWCGWFSV